MFQIALLSLLAVAPTYSIKQLPQCSLSQAVVQQAGPAAGAVSERARRPSRVRLLPIAARLRHARLHDEIHLHGCGATPPRQKGPQASPLKGALTRTPYARGCTPFQLIFVHLPPIPTLSA